jgi:GTP1/Obg family GTP-binding protein
LQSLSNHWVYSAKKKSKDAWDALQNGYQGNAKVLTIKFQTLCRNFESLMMKEGDFMHDYFSNMLDIVKQIRKFGENLSKQKVVEKILRSMPKKYDHVVAAIEESKEQYAFNLFLHNAHVLSNGYNEEEMKLVKETRKIWNDMSVKVTPHI